MIHYLSGLVDGIIGSSETGEGQLSTVLSKTEEDGSSVQAKTSPRLILAGYSYGSMIASHLPSADSVVKLFKNAAEGSTESEIQLRALHLSSQSLKDLESRRERSRGRASIGVPGSHSNSETSHSSSVLVGGFESEAVGNRIEKESRRSLDVRKSLDRVRDRMHSRSHRLTISSERSDADTEVKVQQSMAMPRVYYLIVSPVLPPVAAFATFFSTLSFKGIPKEKVLSGRHARHELAKCPSLAVYGSRDRFTSVKKLRAWADALSQISGSTFQYHEVDGAGHFWHETGALENIENHISEWASFL